MNRIAPSYSAEYLQTEKPRPLSDITIETLIYNLLTGFLDKDISDNVYLNFKKEMSEWIFNSTLNNLTGIETFERIDIINGCTQFIDAIYMQGEVQTINGDYRYHARLNPDIVYSVPKYLRPNIPLIIAMPFPSVGAPHSQMKEILDECLEKQIPVHIDGAWITCCRDINFDFSHAAIASVGISLSKGLGLGWNRIGLRWTKQFQQDSVTIMNDFRMNNRALVKIGLQFIRILPTDYLWNKYGDIYYKICKDFDLTPTNSIYLALRSGHPVGVGPLIRHVAEHNT